MALAPAERIRLIQGAAEALTAMNRTDAELVLETFEIETTSRGISWWDDAYAYFIERLKPVADETLLNLHAYLTDETPAPVAAGSWQGDHHRVFLSHTNAYRKLAGEIRQRLLLEDIDVFVAHDRIETNQEWIDEIKVSLATCETLVALFSDDFYKSKWCDQEVGHALGRGIKVISIMYGAPPHGFVSPKQGYDVSQNDSNAATRIAKEICKLVKGEEPTSLPDPVATVVRKYAQSSSFDQARENLQEVLKLEASDWTPELVEMAEAAGNENGQVSEAWWYEEMVPDVLAEHLADIGVRRPERPTTAEPAPRGPADDEIPF